MCPSSTAGEADPKNVSGSSCRGGPGTGVVDADLKHRKTALQFDRAMLCAFFGAELGLKSSIDFEGKTGFRQFDRSAGHSESIVIGGSVQSGFVQYSTADESDTMA